jgi:integrase
MGHSSIQMTQVYVHIAAEHERKAMNKYSDSLVENQHSSQDNSGDR